MRRIDSHSGPRRAHRSPSVRKSTMAGNSGSWIPTGPARDASMHRSSRNQRGVGLATANGSHLRLSPDNNIDVYIVDVESAQVKRLTSSPGEDRDPSWSPDGTRLAFSSTRDGNSEIYVMRADGSDVRRLTNNSAFDASPTWSPDWSAIAFVSDRDGTRDLRDLVCNASGRARPDTTDGWGKRDQGRVAMVT